MIRKHLILCIYLVFRILACSRRLNASNLFLSLILHLGNLFLIVQLHFSKLFLILKPGVNHTSIGSISTSTIASIKLRKCRNKIITIILYLISCRLATKSNYINYFFFQAEDGIRDLTVTGVQTCALPISLDATVVVRGRTGERAIPFTDFHRLPGDTPERDNVLDRGDLIVAIEVPARVEARA